MPEISVVVLTFNGVKFIKACLDSLFNQGFKEFEVIIVDNGSKDDTANFIKDKFPQATLVKNKDNLGAAKARNQGVDISKGKWILALDCDVVLRKDFLGDMMERARLAGSSIGMLQPKILNIGRETIYSCGIYLTRLKRFHDIGSGRLDNGKFNSPGYIFGACSAAALYRKEMLDEIKEDTGYFDERFFFLAEDVDLACRAQKKGWKALYCPEIMCYHYGNSSSTDNPRRKFFCWRNRGLLLKKQRLNVFYSSVISLLYDLPHSVFLFVTNPYVRNEVLTIARKRTCLRKLYYV